MSKYAKMDGLVEMVYDLREGGAPWDAKGGIVDQVKAAFPGYTTDSAIPLRKLYQAHKAQVDENYKAPATKRSVTKLRDAGYGWAHVAGKTGLTIAAAKKLYDVEKGVAGIAGRVYVDGEGKLSSVRLESTSADKIAAAKAELEAELEEAEELIEEPTEADTEAAA